MPNSAAAHRSTRRPSAYRPMTGAVPIRSTAFSVGSHTRKLEEADAPSARGVRERIWLFGRAAPESMEFIRRPRVYRLFPPEAEASGKIRIHGSATPAFLNAAGGFLKRLPEAGRT